MLGANLEPDDIHPDKIIQEILKLADTLPDGEGERLQAVRSIGLGIRVLLFEVLGKKLSEVQRWVDLLANVPAKLTTLKEFSEETATIITDIQCDAHHRVHTEFLEIAKEWNALSNTPPPYFYPRTPATASQN
jgi:hypothetical protein